MLALHREFYLQAAVEPINVKHVIPFSQYILLHGLETAAGKSKVATSKTHRLQKGATTI